MAIFGFWTLLPLQQLLVKPAEIWLQEKKQKELEFRSKPYLEKHRWVSIEWE